MIAVSEVDQTWYVGIGKGRPSRSD